MQAVAHVFKQLVQSCQMAQNVREIKPDNFVVIHSNVSAQKATKPWNIKRRCWHYKYAVL